MNENILELIRNCKEGDSIVWDEPNGEVYKIKLEKKYPKGWKPTKESKNKMGKKLIWKGTVAEAEAHPLYHRGRDEERVRIIKLIEKDITLQKAKLKDSKKYFEANKIYNWRIDGFNALLSKITGKFHSIGTGGQNTQTKGE